MIWAQTWAILTFWLVIDTCGCSHAFRPRIERESRSRSRHLQARDGQGVDASFALNAHYLNLENKGPPPHQKEERAIFLEPPLSRSMEDANLNQMHTSGHEQLDETDPRFIKRFRFYAYSELFRAVQLDKAFRDSKYFPDMLPKRDLDEIEKEYLEKKDSENFQLVRFVMDNFQPPFETTQSASRREKESVEPYINRMWNDTLIVNLTSVNNRGSLIAIPYPTVIPGGRFREGYYWDALFPFILFLEDPPLSENATTAEAIQAEKEYFHKIAVGMLENMKLSIERFGYIPNGNRDYYLGRSQPPVFAMMVHTLFKKRPEEGLQFLPALTKAFEFWNRSALKEEERIAMTIESDVQFVGRTKQLPSGSRVGIYDSAYEAFPRPEAYYEDISAWILTEKSSYHHPELFRDIKASCEAGWDFSSRFTFSECSQPTQCLRTTQIAPIDLNAFLQREAEILRILYQHTGDMEKARLYGREADLRKHIINTEFWRPEEKMYADLYWNTGNSTHRLTPAAVVPLVFNLSTPEQAEAVLNRVEAELLTAGGILTTTYEGSLSQWDAPFGWAPLQYFTYIAAKNYGRTSLSEKISTRWNSLITEMFERHGRIFEKYNVKNRTVQATGGEYLTQEGFAFTNAVFMLFEKDRRGSSSATAVQG